MEFLILDFQGHSTILPSPFRRTPYAEDIIWINHGLRKCHSFRGYMQLQCVQPRGAIFIQTCSQFHYKKREVTLGQYNRAWNKLYLQTCKFSKLTLKKAIVIVLSQFLSHEFLHYHINALIEYDFFVQLMTVTCQFQFNRVANLIFQY